MAVAAGCFNKRTGMWADEEDDRRSSKKSKERKSYTTPVAFVSGGVKVGDKVTKNTGEDDLNITVCSLCKLQYILYDFSAVYTSRQHLSYDVCLEVRGEIIRTVLCCIVY